MYKDYKKGVTGRLLIEQMNGTEVNNKELGLWHLGQLGFAVKGNNSMFIFDPYLTDALNESGNAPRAFESPILPEQVSNADYVLITHDHGDHLDPGTIQAISLISPRSKYIVPPHCRQTLLNLGIEDNRIISAKAGEAIFAEEAEIIPVAAAHETFEYDEKGNHKFLGYILKANGVTLYHSGDTIVYDELPERLKAFDIEVACVPINGRDWKRRAQNLVGNMNYREAADLGAAIGADLLIPLHYDLFRSNSENPAYFVDYLYHEYPGQRFKMFAPGERMLYLSERE